MIDVIFLVSLIVEQIPQIKSFRRLKQYFKSYCVKTEVVLVLDLRKNHGHQSSGCDLQSLGIAKRDTERGAL